MTENAAADPEKRLFIHLITRDISLADAVLDLIDNSINSAIAKKGLTLAEPKDYISLLDSRIETKLPEINIKIDKNTFELSDTCGGLSFQKAKKSAFKFGRVSGDPEGDTLSVYGIGLKRALFKIGGQIKMKSAHPEGGFKMDLNVRHWESTPQQRWMIPIEHNNRINSRDFGTEIQITELHSDISKRMVDGRFQGDLKRKIARTYIYFLNRIVIITVNGERVDSVDISLGENIASDAFETNGVHCAIVAGLRWIEQGRYTAEDAGWYVFCNGRSVAFADKTPLTGWGFLLPYFQPKHRPFLGLVFLSASNPELLPWTTTKSSINAESEIWQSALSKMNLVGRQVLSFLDKRYPGTDDSVRLSTEELVETTGKSVSAQRTLTSETRRFVMPKVVAKDTSVQFRVSKKDIEKIKVHLGRKSMSNADVGLFTFNYYLETVVEE